MLSNNNRQKSLKRRFLLILGVLRDRFPLILATVAFISFLSLGLMIIFWDSMLPDFPKNQKIIFGLVVIGFAFLRFSRVLRKKPDDE
jgi:hypothetical protein